MKKVIILSLIVAVIVCILWTLSGFEKPELFLTDLRIKIGRNKTEPPEELALILIDETSLKLMNRIVGRWPWPRSIHADVIEFLRLGGAKAILFDILFTENEKVWGRPPDTLSSGDAYLVEETRRSGNTYHAIQIFKDIPDEWNKDLLDKPLPRDFLKRFSLENVDITIKRLQDNNNYAIPFRELYQVAGGIGVVEFSPDIDGIYRRTELIKCYHDACFPVLGLSPFLKDFKPGLIKQSTWWKSNAGWLEIHGKEEDDKILRIPLYKGKYLINLYGRFNPYSMSGVLTSIQKIKMGELENLPVNPEEFRDKIVFIGASAVGVEDLKPTAISPRLPGVILHASLYGNLITKDFIKTIPEIFTPLFIFAIAFFTAFFIFFVKRFNLKLGLSALPSVLFILLTFFLLTKYNLLIELTAPLLSGLLTYLGGFAYLSLTEEREKRRIRSMFSRYVSAAVLSDIETKKEDIIFSEGGKRVELTILFSDLRGFTSISETLDAERVVEVLNCYFSRAVEIIFKHQGTLDKFMGDAIMAFWGAPTPIKDHARVAVLSALEIKTSLPEINAELQRKGLPPLQVGIGINTGEVVLGNIGSPQRLDYTVIGDNVNLASRLEGLTRFYGIPILISEKTFRGMGNTIPARIIDLVRVKGKAEPIKIYEPLEDVKITLLSEEAFYYYLGRRWQDALKLYKEVLRILPDDPVATLFVNRCERFLIQAPAEWDGIYEFREK